MFFLCVLEFIKHERWDLGTTLWRQSPQTHKKTKILFTLNKAPTKNNKLHEINVLQLYLIMMLMFFTCFFGYKFIKVRIYQIIDFVVLQGCIILYSLTSWWHMKVPCRLYMNSNLQRY
jgi:hypothetical protein